MAKQNYDYINQYAREHYDRVQLVLPKGSRERIKALAQAAKKTMNEYICDFLPVFVTNIIETKDETVEEEKNQEGK